MICAAHCVQGQVASLDAVSIFNDMNSDGNSDLNFLEKSTTIIFRIGVATILFYQEFLKNLDGISLFLGKSRLLIKIRIPVGKAYGLIAALPEFMIGEFYLHS